MCIRDRSPAALVPFFTRLGFHPEGEAAGGMQPLLLLGEELCLDSCQAVSYTHLDVYKRQRLLRVAYALPGQPSALPPGGLKDYCWMQGRHGQGYWVRFQNLRPDYAALPPEQDVYAPPP